MIRRKRMKKERGKYNSLFRLSPEKCLPVFQAKIKNNLIAASKWMFCENPLPFCVSV